MKGISLIEVTLSVAIILIIAAISAPMYQSFLAKNDLISTEDLVVNSLRRAQTLSLNGEGDSMWGVKFSNELITVFKGDSYATRQTDYDEEYLVPKSVNFSGNDEIIFSEVLGEPDDISDITIANNINESKTIQINEKGILSY